MSEVGGVMRRVFGGEAADSRRETPVFRRELSSLRNECPPLEHDRIAIAVALTARDRESTSRGREPSARRARGTAIGRESTWRREASISRARS